MTATHLRLTATRAGGHVHLAVFAGVPGFTYAKAGDLCFTVDEWPFMRELLTRAGDRVDLLEDARQPGTVQP